MMPMAGKNCGQCGRGLIDDDSGVWCECGVRYVSVSYLPFGGRLMGETSRIVFLPCKQILFGFQWLTEDYYPYPLHISIALPFVSIDIGIGKRRAANSGASK